MTHPVEDSNVVGFHTLASPAEVKESLPLTPEIAQLVLQTRREIRDIIRGVDPCRLVVIVGPCSIHDPEAALDYARRLGAWRARLADSLLVLMRTYFEKPRTTVGWKGLINDPSLDGTGDVGKGLRLARKLLLALNQEGIPCASEVLDPITPQYTGDLLSWASIGARTTESQTHREMTSGLSMPVGFKNATDGSLDPAVNALISAGNPHAFLGINREGRVSMVRTNGNPDRHVVLRGGMRPNYHREDVESAVQLIQAADPTLKRPIMVDTSHGNSRKDYTRQGLVCREVAHQYSTGMRAIMGLLIESNLQPGNQKWSAASDLKYGVSITDACIGWEETTELLEHLARVVRAVQQAA